MVRYPLAELVAASGPDVSDNTATSGMEQTLHAVDVLAAVRERLEGSGWALYTFLRLSSEELELLVWQETHDAGQQVARESVAA